MNKREFRAAPIAPDKDMHGFWADVVTFGPVDSYGTRWDPNVFDESLAAKMPVLAWGHDWADPIGRADDHAKTDTAQRVHFRLDDGDYVPRAKQALYQMQSGTITDVSVGILRRADRTNDDETVTITKADLDEVSLVLAGAVPGAQIDHASVRSRTYIDLASGTRREAPKIALADVLDLAKRVNSNEVTLEDAKTAIDLLAAGPVPPPAEPPQPPEPNPDGTGGQTDPGTGLPSLDPDVAAAEAEADAAVNEFAAGMAW